MEGDKDMRITDDDGLAEYLEFEEYNLNKSVCIVSRVENESKAVGDKC